MDLYNREDSYTTKGSEEIRQSIYDRSDRMSHGRTRLLFLDPSTPITFNEDTHPSHSDSKPQAYFKDT